MERFSLSHAKIGTEMRVLLIQHAWPGARSNPMSRTCRSKWRVGVTSWVNQFPMTSYSQWRTMEAWINAWSTDSYCSIWDTSE